MSVVKITLKPIDDSLTENRFKIVQLENAIKVRANSQEFGVGDSLTESEAEKLLQDRHNKVTVKS